MRTTHSKVDYSNGMTGESMIMAIVLFPENLDHLMEHQVPLMEKKVAKDFIQDQDSD